MPKKLQRKVTVQRQKPAQAVATTRQKAAGGGLFGGRRVTTKLLTEFTSQLAVLLDAGIPVTKCLRILEGQMPPGGLRRALVGVTEDVESGTSLSESLAKYPAIFDHLYTSMVSAGEAGGVQEIGLTRVQQGLCLFFGHVFGSKVKKAETLRFRSVIESSQGFGFVLDNEHLLCLLGWFDVLFQLPQYTTLSEVGAYYLSFI